MISFIQPPWHAFPEEGYMFCRCFFFIYIFNGRLISNEIARNVIQIFNKFSELVYYLLVYHFILFIVFNMY